jgi:hypothetical protein
VRALGSPVVSAKAHALSLVPGGVPVSASNQLGARLAERHYSYTFPTVRRAKWIVVDSKDPTYGNAKAFKRLVRRYEADETWRVIFSSHGVAVLHKRATFRP